MIQNFVMNVNLGYSFNQTIETSLCFPTPRFDANLYRYNVSFNLFTKCYLSCDLKMELINEDPSFIIPLNDTINLIDNKVKEFAIVNKPIKGDNFIIQIYPTNHPIPIDDKVSTIDLNQCEVILKRENGLSPTDELIIVKIDIIEPISLINKVEYKIYSKDGKNLNLLPCLDIKANVSYPINNISDVDIDVVEDMNNQNINIFNPEDAFFK